MRGTYQRTDYQIRKLIDELAEVLECPKGTNILTHAKMIMKLTKKMK